MSSVCLVVLCGVPGAGKTTWSRNFKERVMQTRHVRERTGRHRNSDDDDVVSRSSEYVDYRVTRVAYDDLIPEDLEKELIGGDPEKPSTDGKGWKEFRKTIVRFVGDLLRELSSSKDETKRGICDRKSRATVDYRNSSRDEVIIDDSRNSSLSDTGLSPSGCSFDEKIEDEILPLDHCRDVFHEKVKDRRKEFDRLVRKDICDERLRPENRDRRIVLIDDNMYYASMRYEYYQLARKHSAGYAQIYFPVDPETALERNSTRGERRVSDSVIRSMLEKLEEPSVEKNAWEKYTTVWSRDDSTVDDYSKVLAMIDEALKNPAQPPSDEDKSQATESRFVCSINQLHRADIALRKILGSFISSCQVGKMKRSEMATLCNSIRLNILTELRTGCLSLPDDVMDDVSSDGEDQFYIFLNDLFMKKFKNYSR